MNMSCTRYLQSGFALLALVLLLQVTPALADQGYTPKILSPDTPHYGKTYGQWSNAWWQWAYSIPKPENPLLDQTGADCDSGQSGPVWFLAGVFNGGTVTRRCTVPDGKALFFPILNFENDNIGVTPPKTVDQLRDQLNGVMKTLDPSTFVAKIDGESIQHLGRYRAGPNNGHFSFTLPKNNIYNFQPTPPPGTYSPVVSDGYYLMVAPLRAGTYTIHFVVPGNQDVTYHLTVEN